MPALTRSGSSKKEQQSNRRRQLAIPVRAIPSRCRSQLASVQETKRAPQSTRSRVASGKQRTSSSLRQRDAFIPAEQRSLTPRQISTQRNRQGQTATPNSQDRLASTERRGRTQSKRKRRVGPAVRARSRSPRKRISKREEGQVVEDLLNRIRSLSMKDRPIPESTDPSVLGFELKVRLAARAPTFVETGRRGGIVHVTQVQEKFRHVPMWDISPQQDPELLCCVRVKTVEEERRRDRGVR